MDMLDTRDATRFPGSQPKDYWMQLRSNDPFEKYPARQHARRTQEKLNVDDGLVYLVGQVARNNDDSDMPAPFRQLRYFYYLSGCNEADCHLVYDIRYDLLSLFIPRIDPNRVIWNGRGSTRAEALGKYDINEVYYVDQLPLFLEHWAGDAQNFESPVYVLHSSQVPPYLPGVGHRIDFNQLQPAINTARMIKDDHEIKLIKRANDISSHAHEQVLSNILKFTNEAQVEGLFMDICISKQAKTQAYSPICASGPNAGTLHYEDNNQDLAGRQLMCLDAGCEVENYASDITRTFPLSAVWPSHESENIYKLVERMQEACIGGLAPGVRYLDLHILAHQIAIKGLLDLGIFHHGTAEEIYHAGTSRAFFPHGLGHHVGLEVHDPGQRELMSIRRGKAVLTSTPSLYPDNFHVSVYDSLTCFAPADPLSSVLAENMVVTVEPGIYFSVYALKQFYLPSPIHSKYINAKVVERYLSVGGVRIEDDVLITCNGYENLTKAPKGEAMLRVIQNRGLCEPFARARQTRSKEVSRVAHTPGAINVKNDVDFETFPGPSLFSDFQHSMATMEKEQG